MHLKKAIRIFKYAILCMVLFFVLIITAVNLPFVQNWLTGKANSIFIEKEIPAHVDRISVYLTGRIGLENVLILKGAGDTIVYAGQIKISAKIIPLLFKKITIQSISITNAVVHIESDTVTGTLDLVKVFSGDGKSSPKISKERSGRRWDIAITSVYLDNIHFTLVDSVNGLVINESLKKLSVTCDRFSITERKIFASYLSIDNAQGGLSLTERSEAKNDKRENPHIPWSFRLSVSHLQNIHYFLEQKDRKKLIDFSIAACDISGAGVIISDPLTISAGRVKISDGSMAIETSGGSVEPLRGDISNKISSLNTSVSDIIMSRKSSGFSIDRISFLLGNGFELKNGELRFRSDSTLNSSLAADLSTLSSRINLDLKADGGLDSIISSFHSIPFSVRISNTQISADDILDFFPMFLDNQTSVSKKDFNLGIECDLNGTTDLINIKKLMISNRERMILSMSGQLGGILKPSSAYCSVNFKTGNINKIIASDILKAAGSEITLPDFNSIVVGGDIDSTFLNPRFNLTLLNDSGRMNISGSINMKDKSYRLKGKLTGIDIGRLAGIKEAGAFSGEISFSGYGFRPTEMKLDASISIDSFLYRGYDYNAITANIKGDKGLFSLDLKTRDQFFKSNLTGSMDLNGNILVAKVIGNIDINAGELGLYKGVSVTGGIEAGLDHSADISNGSITLRDFIVNRDNRSEDIKYASLSFHYSDTLLSGKIESDFLNAEAEYKGSIAGIKKAISESRMRGSAIADSAIGNRIPYFSSISEGRISIESKYDPFISLFLSDTLFNFNRVSLDFVKDTKATGRAEISIDRFKVGKTLGYGTEMKFENSYNRSYLMIKSDSITLGKISLAAINTEINIGGDTASFSLKSDGMNDSLLYDINGIAFRSGEDLRLKATRNQWVINGYRWNITPVDFLVLNRINNGLIADLHLMYGDRSIDIYGKRSEGIFLEFRNLWLSQLMVPGMNTFRYNGIITGKIGYSGINGKTEAGANMNIRQIEVDHSLLGDLDISGKLTSDTTGTVAADIRAVMNDTSSINLAVRSGKSVKRKTFTSEFSAIKLSTFEPLVSKYITDLSGLVEGNLSFTSDNGKNQLDGRVRIRNTTLRLAPLNARFYLPEDEISFANNKMVFSKFTVLDSLRNLLTLNGSVNLEDPGNLTADLQVTSDRLQIMNTTEKDNKGFNGTIYINSDINIKGPVQRPLLNGNIVLASGTVINYRYTEDLEVSETQKTVVFTSFQPGQTQAAVKPSIPDRLNKTPNVEATVVIDPNSLFNFQITRGFDIGVSITGGGFLTYSMLQNKEIDLTGTYEIAQGSSVLKIPGWPRKDFSITSGSYLKWDGKLDDPELNVETTSKVRGSYYNPVDQKNREVNFLVYMKLSGRLSELEILFDVRSEDQYITTVFNSLSADERMKQAINLLIFGSIQLPNLSSSSDYVTQQINQFWESQLNQLTRSAIKKFDVSLGIDTYTEEATAKTYTSLSYQVKKEMFKDRGSVLVSGHMNDNTPSSQQSNNVIENFIFEYALDTNRTKFVKVYRQQNYEDLLEGEVVKSGIGFIYRKSYDRISDIWRRRKHK